MDKLVIHSIDHIVMQAVDVLHTIKFYTEILGMTHSEFQPPTGGQCASLFILGHRRSIYMMLDHLFGHMPKTQLQGSVDLCFITQQPLSDWQQHFSNCGIMIEDGPVRKTGANGPLLSIYIRDPDGNLIEISNYI